MDVSQKKSFQELPMGSQIHSFLCYSSNHFIKYSWLLLVWAWFFFLTAHSGLASLLPFQGTINFLLPVEKQQRKEALQHTLLIYTSSSPCSHSSSARLWEQLLPASVQMAASSWCLSTSGAYAKINHFLTLITFYPCKILENCAESCFHNNWWKLFNAWAQHGLQPGW